MIRHYQAIRNGFSLCLNTLSFAPHVVLRLILVRSSALHAVRQSLKTLLIYLLTFQTLRVLDPGPEEFERLEDKSEEFSVIAAPHVVQNF